ncbi:MAG: methyltransferase domain-containing protein [Candidatus Rokubacteria bacterium]|nr:methyltransferase domain-containing protein [Candidatus Rokubacteria bacterium]
MNVAECLDGWMSNADRRAELADIHRLNAWFGGYAVTLHAVASLARPRDSAKLTVADIGGGDGQFARRIVEWTQATHPAVLVLVIDRDPATPAPDPRALPRGSKVVRIRADALALPLRDGSADLATMSLLLHHLDPSDATSALAEMRRVARLGAVVSDLLRSRWSVALVWAATRIFAATPMARRDGPLSVRRAYSEEELHEIARSAGMTRVDIRRYPVLARLTAILS